MGDERELVLASRNVDKVAELADLLLGLDLRVRAVAEFAGVPEVEETEPDLEGNAVLKARTVALACGRWALADDTGLEVDALGGAPGVYTARYAGPDATYADNVAKLLSALEALGAGSDRSARFRTVVALSDPRGETSAVAGVCEGVISVGPAGDAGFGYDPIFVPLEGGGDTFSEMSREEKGRISHRGRAMAAALGEIRRRMGLAGD